MPPIVTLEIHRLQADAGHVSFFPSGSSCLSGLSLRPSKIRHPQDYCPGLPTTTYNAVTTSMLAINNADMVLVMAMSCLTLVIIAAQTCFENSNRPFN